MYGVVDVDRGRLTLEPRRWPDARYSTDGAVLVLGAWETVAARPQLSLFSDLCL